MASLRNSITPVLAVRGGREAVAFYKRAFGAEEIRCDGFGDGLVIVELAVGEARFRVTDEVASNPGPQTLGGTSVRLNLFVADPDGFVERAVAHGAVLVAAVADQPFGLRQGRVSDPYGHHWLIGRPLDGEAGAWARPSPPRSRDLTGRRERELGASPIRRALTGEDRPRREDL